MEKIKMTEWQNVKLGDVTVSISRGITPAYTDSEKCMVFNQKCIRDGRISFNDARYHQITGKGVGSSKIVSKEDTLICSTGVGTLGRVGRFYEFPDIISTTDSHVSIVKPDTKKVFPLFLSYVLISKQKEIERLAKGSTGQTELPREDLEKLDLSLPPLDIQKKIAAVLSALDDKIELNNKINQNLELQAQALFKSWFVDFDIVKDKALGVSDVDVCAKYQISSEICDLFPSEFSSDNLPKGWEQKGLPEIATYLNGLPLQKFPPESDKDFLPVVKIAELKARSVVGADKASKNIDPKYIIDDGDVIFSWSGSLAVDIWCCGKGALNQHLFKVSSDVYPKWFYYLWTKTHLFEFQQIAAGKATTMGHIQRSHLEKAKANIPSKELLNVADKVFSPMIDKFIENSKENARLAELRDTLLPKLMSGEINVDNVKIEV